MAELIRSCAGLWLEAVATEHTLAGGDSLKVAATAVNRSRAALTLGGVMLGVGGSSMSSAPAAEGALDDNMPVTRNFAVKLPADLDWQATQPWWLRDAHGKGALAVPDSKLFDDADTPPVASATFTIRLNSAALTA